MMEVVTWAGERLGAAVNEACEGRAAWEIIVATAATTLLLMWGKDFLFKEQSLFERAKKTFFHLARKIPQVQAKIDQEINKMSESMMEDLNRGIQNTPYLVKMPDKGWTPDQILDEATKYTQFGSFDWKSGCASGTVYNNSLALTNVMTRVYGLSAWTNPLHPDVFPGVRKMEAEVVRMTCGLFHGDDRTCGCMTTGGTESIIMACKAYRDWAVNVRGITNPEMVVPVSAHAAFDKGAQLLAMRIKHAPLDPKTMKVNVAAMKKMITKNTCMLAVSAPQFPQGVIDPVGEVGALGEELGLPVHVDACLGGFLIPFMEDAGYSIPLFDFRVPGVTSISADTHKYGYAPKGSSVVMYRNESWRHHQFFVTPDWPGGIYATSTIAGSRSGGIVAACWAALVFHGREGYVEHTRDIIATTRKIRDACGEIQGVFVYGEPEVSVVALGSEVFNIYLLSDRMAKRGWNLNALQNPACIHIAVTVLHTQPGVAEKFITDVKEISAELLLNPPEDSGGSAALYGMAQSIPDRSLVGEMAWCYLDAVLSTKQSPQASHTPAPAQQTEAEKPTEASNQCGASKPAVASNHCETSKSSEASKPSVTSNHCEASKPAVTSNHCEALKPFADSNHCKDSKPSTDSNHCEASKPYEASNHCEAIKAPLSRST